MYMLQHLWTFYLTAVSKKSSNKEESVKDDIRETTYPSPLLKVYESTLSKE